MNAKRKGMALEAKIMTDLLRCGCAVSTPWGDTERYDLVVDVGGDLLRIQVKSARTRNGGETIEFDCRSNHYTSKGIKHNTYSADEVDYFATAYGETSYLVPVSECGSAKVLRLGPAKNNQQKRITCADRYELAKVINELTNKEREVYNDEQAGGIQLRKGDRKD